MPKFYKVWLHVEVHDTDEDAEEEYYDLDCLNMGCIGTFESEDAASTFAQQLQDYGEGTAQLAPGYTDEEP